MANNSIPFSSAQFNISSGPSTLCSSDKFKMPSEPRPLSSFDSDEESFVVLGKSLNPEDEMASDEIDQPVGTSVVEEAKQLINKELRAVEQMSLKSKNISSNENRENISTKLMTNSNISATLEKYVGSTENGQQTEQTTDFPEMPHVDKGFETTNTISIATFSNDLNSVEVQNKISQIIEENIHLKDTILQNNMSMKSQYERIVAWQEDVQKVHQQHKEKILEAKEIIEKLKKENSNLTHEKDRFKQIVDMQNEELSLLKKEMKDNIERSSESVTGNQENLQEIINKQIQEMTALKAQLNNKEKECDMKNMHSMENLQQIIEKQKQEIDFLKQQLQETEKQVNEKLVESTENLKKVIEAQKQELTALKIILKDKERHVNEKLTKSTDNNLKEFELDIANKKIKELELSIQNLTLEICTLKSEKLQLQDNKGESEKRERELQETLQKLKMVEQEFETLTTVLIEKEGAHMQAIDDLRSLKQHYANMPSPEELLNIKTQLSNTQVTLTQVEQTRAAAYSQINVLNREIQELNQRIEERQVQEDSNVKDELFALQTQLEVYKTDFEQERKAKEAIKEEKEKIIQDLQNLHRRNQQLQEEIEIVRENRDFHVYPPRQSRTSSSNAPSAPSDNPMKCPKCNFGFHTIQALENHVYRCIEIDEHLP